MPRQQQQDKPESFLLDMKQSTNLAYFLASVHAMAILPLIRTGMGKRGVGPAGFFSFPLIWLYGGLCNGPEMIAYSYVWLIAVIYRKLTQDVTQHTQYQGWPILTGWLFTDELTARKAEAALMWFIGMAVSQRSPALGQFLVFGTASLGVKYLIEAAIEERQIEAAHNAAAEAEAARRRMEEAARRRRGR